MDRRLEPCHESRIIGTGDSNSNRTQIDPSVALKIAQNLKILRDIVAKQRKPNNFEVCSNTDFGEEVEEESNEESQQQIEFRKRFNTFLNKSKQKPQNQQIFHENNCDKFSSNWIDESNESNFQIEEDSQDDDIDKIRIYYDLPLLLNCLQFSNQNRNCPKFLIENSSSSSSSISRTNQKLTESSRRRQTSNSSNSSHKTASNEVTTRPTSSSVAFTRKVVELRNIYNSDEFAKFNDDNDEDYLDLDQDVDIVLEDDPEDTDIDDPYGPCDSEDLNRIRPDPGRSDNYQVPLRNCSSSIHQTVPKKLGKIPQSQLPNSQKRLTTSIEIANSGSWNHRPTKLAANKTSVTSIPKITLPPSSSSSSFSSASQSASPPPYSPSSLNSSSSSSSLSLSPPSLQSSQPSSSSKQNLNRIPGTTKTIEPTIPNINGEIEHSNSQRRPSCLQHSSARNYDRQVIKRWIVEKRRIRSEQILAEQLRKQLEKEKIAENCRKLLEKIRHRSNIATVKTDNRPQMAPPPSTQQQNSKQSIRSQETSSSLEEISNNVDSAPNYIIDYPDYPQYSSGSSYPSSNPPSFNCQSNCQKSTTSSSFPSNHNDIISDEDFFSLIQDFEEEEVYKKLPIISSNKISPNSQEETQPPTPVVRAQQKSRVLRMLAGSLLAPKEDFCKKIPEKFENQQILNEILCRSQEEEFANFEKENSLLELSLISELKKNPETSTNSNSVDETNDEDPIELSLEDSKISDSLPLNGSSVPEIPQIEESPIPNWNQLCHRVFQSKSVIEKTSQTSSPPPPIDLIQFLSAKSSSLSPIIDYFTTQPTDHSRFRSSNIDSCQISKEIYLTVEDSQSSSPQSNLHHYPNHHQQQQQQQQPIQQPFQHQTAPFPAQFEDIQQINVKQLIAEQSSRIFNLYRVAQNQKLNFEQLIRNLEFSSSSYSSSPYRQFLFDLCKEIVLNHFDIQSIDVDPSKSLSSTPMKQQQSATSLTLLLPLQMQKQPFPRDNLEKFTQQIWLHVSRVLPSQLPSEATSIATSDEILPANNAMETQNSPNYNYNSGKKSKLKRFGLMAYCRMQRKLDFVDSVLYREMLQDEQRWSGYFEPEIEEIKRQQQRESGNSRI